MEWHPIETAPKDGTEVILGTTRGKSRGRILIGMFYENGDWGDTDDVVEDMLFYDEYLPHWMPLPKPPTT